MYGIPLHLLYRGGSEYTYISYIPYIFGSKLYTNGKKMWSNIFWTDKKIIKKIVLEYQKERKQSKLDEFSENGKKRD